MTALGGGVPWGKDQRYTEYLLPSTKWPDTEIDQGLARSLIALGQGVPAFGSAGCHVFQIWKLLKQVITETAKISVPKLSPYCKEGFEQKMCR